MIAKLASARRSLGKGVAAITVAIAVVASAIGAGSAFAQDYPSGPITIVAPFAPGGNADNMARILADIFRERWPDASIAVVNKPGVGGGIGAQFVARSDPDGLTMVIGYDGSFTVGPLLMKEPLFDPIKDFQPVTQLVDQPFMVIANTKYEADNLQDAIADSKSKPEGLNYAFAGDTMRLVGELLRAKGGMNWVPVPYGGGAKVIAALLADEIPVAVLSASGSAPTIKDGRIKALAVSSSSRLEDFPDVPTLAESGVEGVSGSSWLGLFVAAGTPMPIVDLLNEVTREGLEEPGFMKRMKSYSMEIKTSTVDEFQALIQSDIDKWAGVIADAGFEKQ